MTSCDTSSKFCLRQGRLACCYDIAPHKLHHARHLPSPSRTVYLQLGIRDLLKQHNVPHHFVYFSLDAEGQVSVAPCEGGMHACDIIHMTERCISYLYDKHRLFVQPAHNPCCWIHRNTRF